MAESINNPNNKVFNKNDTFDINELAALNDDISADFIDKLQNKITAENVSKKDGDLFEEVPDKNNSNENKSQATFNRDIDDNFIKKYKAKLKKQQESSIETDESDEGLAAADKEAGKIQAAKREAVLNSEEDAKLNKNLNEQTKNQIDPQKNIIQDPGQINFQENTTILPKNANVNDNINAVSGGNIMEHPISQDKLDYKNSLDYLDDNTKYSKYVIYIDPENKSFIDSLTVKERKNLINRILREQDAIDVTKHKLGKMQTIIKHIIVAILTILMAVPCIYWAVNTSLETTINNYRQSQSAFEVLYREKGKLKKIK